MTKVFKTEVRSDCEAGGLPEAVVFEIDLAAAQLIGRLARLVTENALHLVEKFDSTARFLVLADGHEPVATELGKLRVSATEFWFSAYLKHTTVLVLSERLPLDKLAEAFGPDLDGIAAELLAPAVSADAHTDDRRLEPEFDAARWLAQASDEDVLLLARCQWGGDYPADAVAVFMADHDEGVKALFEYNDVLQKAGARNAGFECHVNPQEAMLWLKTHRAGVWARITCEVNEVSLVQAQEEEVRGRWDWLDGHGNASDTSFDTEGDAALNAVETLALDPFPK